tara:strand:+ start:561 stop:857 length:297 start_codon:yes stop_codon:yes gene_type:complete
MIEAINSTLASVQAVTKPAVQAVSKPVVVEKATEASPKVEGFYFSRNVRVDNASKVAVLEFRNPLTGDVKAQIPTEAQLKAYTVAEARAEIQQQENVA